MKIIDLLVKISKGEKLPNKIKYKNKIWRYIGDECDYVCNDEDDCLFEGLFRCICTNGFINDEIEIIEEDNKLEIIKTDKIIYDDSETDKDDEYVIEISDLNNELVSIGEKCSDETKITLYLIRKINELINEVKKLKGVE